MKKICLSALLLVLSAGFILLKAAPPANPEFPGVEKAMTPANYEAAGLQ